MEFNFIINKLVQLDQQGLGVYIPRASRSKVSSQQEQQLGQVLNTMGERSAIAQGLKQVITNYDKVQGTDQRVYIVAEGRTCQGFLKVGQKNLFYRDMMGNIKEIKPLCVLDFYVHESCQRQGYGKLLFEYMIQCEQTSPEKLAYDRPSPKLIAFLKKHYNLVKYIAQNNNFVVFDQYFRSDASSQNKQNQNTRSYSQPYSDYSSQIPTNYPQQQQQQSNSKSYPYKQENNIDLMQHSSSRNNKEFLNAGRAILSKEEIYKKDNLSQQNIENTLNNINNSQYSTKSQQQQQYQKDYQLDKYENNWGADKNIKKPPFPGQDRQLDKIQQKIQQTERELDVVNQQIIKQRQNLSQDPLTQNHRAQNVYNTNQFGTSPWAQTGFNYYSTSSSNYGNHYTYYKK
ncbi:alpha-tubulin N-acetyltransferase (macronuclear) [Tetrahymena thermophila SB210]|uniref:Alpha-tubulin N-acetyltransferase n=1 Tax=Tetrahymena thermophila (strain SB210) TaxID=312017 RepID=ATAT_TETTS|nr:alpha-tubulin N-acetyltransferase [Tetrahymena thermophila SB210]Q22XZ3.2 RecName: Full=Alpha-tubulin N-acetyltransferase; Short=Alpha-TAT; Short=TAT; AltName: Full=Acetyltransferase mec-17 homolog [Tetrahymena thermophila SB210]EAR90231.2 alpha-tubulin N-acetyltransferase [Tetrahymena thermophila SB210]|eukprot:XP_001010476.2 alpha-tubulin N-acetyltransferase [Tetrahymena thermophila SB210]